MNRKTTGQWIIGKIRKRILGLLIMTVSHMGSALLGVAFALMCKNMIDTAIKQDQQGFLYACLWQGLVIAGMLVCTVLYRHLHGRLAADIDRDLKRDLFFRLTTGDYASVSGYHTGELINRLSNDVRTVHEGMLGVLPNAAAMLTKLIAAISVLAVLEPVFTIVVGAGAAVVLAVTGLLRPMLKGIHKKVSEEEGRVSGFFQETLEKLLMVQALDVAPQMLARADELLDRRYRAQMRRKNVSLLTNTAVHFLMNIAGFVALIWCAFGLFAGTLSVGGLTAITQLVSQLQRPFVGMSGIIPQYMAMLASAERLMELEQIEPEPTTGVSLPDYAAITEVGAEQLTFAYDRDTVFRDASFGLPVGGFAAVTGASGIGKSTLLKLLLGIIHPQSGRLYAQCGQERVTLDRQTRRLFAYVPQGNLLLSGTLRENLTVVKPTATAEEIAQAVHVSAMDEYLPLLPQGLDTPVGENAAGLSEGQSQRLAIARAVLGGAPILLLDECTSALDEKTEQTVLHRLRDLPGRMCIAVTHRPAARELCDWTLEIEDGRIRAIKTSANKQG